MVSVVGDAVVAEVAVVIAVVVVVAESVSM